MKNSTFSAQVANNLLTLLQGYSKTIRLLLVMFLTLTVTTNAWAEEVTYVFTSKAWAAKIGSTVANWTSNKAGAGFSNNGIQVTTAATGANGTSPISYNNISQIVVTYNTNKSKGKGTLSVKIGDNAVTTNNWQYSGSADGTSANFTSTFDYPSPQSGKVTLMANTTTNSIYVVSIKIVTSAGSGSTPDPCTTPTVAWNTKPANGEVGDSMTASVTTNYSNGLTYSSSNQTVATVTNEGVINYLSAGITTITATVTGDGTTFCEGPVSVQQEITVTAPAGGDGSDGECSWTLVADASTLKVDDEVIIAASNNDYAISTTQANNNRTATPITKDGTTLSNPSTSVQVLTLKEGTNNGTWALYTGSGYLYAAASGSNHLKTQQTNNVNGSWTITITNNIASIVATGSSNRNVMQFNPNNGSPIFACYASASQTSLALYKKVCSSGGDDPEPTKTLTSIEITTPATQTTFWQGETFNHNGLVVTAHYSDAADEVVTPTVTGSTATAGTATVNVSYKEQSTSYTITVKAIPNTKETAYTVADAYDIIDKLTTAEGVFISGTISQVDSYSDQYKSITYWISADGTTTKQLQVYSGKGLESADFDAVTNLSVGDQVIVCGDLKKYKETYEFDKNNYLVSHTPTTKDPAGLAYATTSYTANVGEAFTTPELTNPHNLVVTYSTSDASKATVNENTGTVTIIAAGTVTITASTMGDASHEPGSASYTITISNPAMAVATLPFTFNSGKADIENTAGMTQNGLGSDYSASTAPNSQLKFDGTGDWVVIRFDSEPGMLSYDIKGNSYSGGTFTVQESADGETYTNVAVHTEITETQSEEHKLLSTSRYVKFIYTKKENGNVGLGNIQIAKPDLRQEAGIAWSTESVEITVGEDFTPPTLSNPNGLTLTCTSNNEDLVTVTNAGVITLKESVTGTATITATFDGDATYKPAEVSCTITVNALYTVTLNPNYPAGKTGTFKDKEGNTVNGNLEVLLPSGTASQALTNFYSSIELDNYAFDGFYTQAEGGSKRVNTGDITGNITFYAHWKEKYTITWSVNGNTALIEPTTFAAGDNTWEMPTTDYDCSGKGFVGWTTNPIIAAQDEAPDPLYTNASQFPNATATYHAVFAEGGSGGSGGYKKLTEALDDYSGEYLIVYETDKVAFNGGLTTLDATSNYISVTITDGVIASNATTDAAKFTFAKVDGGYSILSASGKYIGREAASNGLNATSTYAAGYLNTITYNSIKGKGEASLKYNNASDQKRFRYFASGQQAIALYKKSGSSATYTAYTTSCGTYTVTFYGFNSGGYTTTCNGNLAVYEVEQGGTYVIPNCEPTFDPAELGRTFAGTWNTQANGKGTAYEPGDEITNVSNDITLYAQWALNTSENTTLPTDVEDLATTDVVVTGGTTLTLKAGTTTINSLTLKGGLIGDGKSGNYAMPSVWVPEGAKLVRKNTTINLDLVVNSKSWYPFAVPFAATINANVEYLEPTLAAASEYGTHFAIKTYDGARRAEEGVDQTNNWVQLKRNEKLQPGVGYIISALTYPDKDTATIRIPMSVPNEWLANGEQTTVNDVTRNAVAVTAYTGAAATEHQRHAGWNFVANPYLSMFAGNNASNEDGSFITGELLINKGNYSYGGEEVPYVTIPTYNFEHYYQVELSEATLSPAYSFFVQVGKSGTMTFATDGRQQAPASIAARNAEERPVKMDVDITLSDNHSSDQTGIIISDRYSEAYEIGRDLEKLFGSAYNLSVYTLMADNTPLAFQALAIRSNMQVIPVGYRTPAQGEYTFRLNEATSSIDLLNEQYEQLVLVDYQTGELTNLLIADYTFYSERTQADNRFAIYAVPRQNAPTDLPNAIGQDKQAQKIIHNGHLYILRDGNVYNGNGQIVK